MKASFVKPHKVADVATSKYVLYVILHESHKYEIGYGIIQSHFRCTCRMRPTSQYEAKYVSCRLVGQKYTSYPIFAAFECAPILSCLLDPNAARAVLFAELLR